MMTVMVMICQGTQNLNAFYAKKYVVSNDDDDDEWVFWRLKTRVVQTIGRDKSLSQRNWQKLHCFRNSVDIICKSGPRTPPKCPISRNSLSLLLANTIKNEFKFLHEYENEYDETCLYCQFANCSIIQESANVRQASKAWTVRFLANVGGEQEFNLWQSCKILLALTIFSKMFLWLQIWDRLRVPVLLLLQELSRLRLGDRRVSVQPGQSWWHVFVKLVTRFVKEFTCIFTWWHGSDHMVADPGNVKCHPWRDHKKYSSEALSFL